MYGFMCKNKGAISVFLVIVLVPMLVVSSLFVDISRVELAKSVAESSGVVTLNTALTNYDAVLKDMYGLFATSQNTDEMFENLEDYYRKCIESAGVAEPDADNYVEQIMQFVKSETGSDDILNMDLTSFEVTKPTGGDLANPAILKEQIVEFMKYRGPISLGSGIFDALSSIKNVKKQTKLVESKSNFYDKQTDIMSDLEKVWNYIEDYQYRDAQSLYKGDTHTFPGGDYVETVTENIDSLKEQFKDCMTDFVKYVYFADTNYIIQNSGLDGYGVTKTTGGDGDYTEKWTVVATDKKEYSINKVTKKTEKAKDSDIKKIESYLTEIYKAQTALNKLKSDAKYLQISNGNSNMLEADKIKAVCAFNSFSEYHNNIKNLVENLAELKNLYNKYTYDGGSALNNYTAKADENEKKFTVEKCKDGETGNLGGVISGQLNLLTDEDGSEISIYNNHLDCVRGYWSDTHEAVRQARENINNMCSYVYATTHLFDLFLDDKIEKLDKAIGLLNGIKTDLGNSESEYNKALKEWQSSANNLKGDTIGNNDLSEIERVKDILTVDEVQKLITRLEGAKTTLSKIKNQNSQYKTLDTAWLNFEGIDYSNLREKLTDAQKNKIESGDYDSAIEDLCNTVYGYFDLDSASVNSTDSKSPDLTKEQVKLYTWLYSNFFKEGKYSGRDLYTESGTSTTDETTKLSSNKETAKDQNDTTEKEAKKNNEKTLEQTTAPDRDYLEKYLPSQEWNDTVTQLEQISTGGKVTSSSEEMLKGATSALDMFNDLITKIGSMATDLRDDMYIASYIMNMFSYSTYEQEIVAKYGDSESLGDGFESWYKYDSESGKYTYSDYLNKQKNKSVLLDKAKTLTKVGINPNSSYLYGKEVEYIIFGSESEDNDPRTAAYGTIYAIRFAMNTAYAFTDKEIAATAQAAATALFGVPPLTPLIPVAKVAMTIGFALAESAYDLYQLKCGKEIPLMKNSDTWMMKPTNAMGTAIQVVGNAVLDETSTMLNEVLNKTDDELSKMIEAGGKELDTIATSIVGSTIEELQGYGEQTLQEFMSICDTIGASVDTMNQTIEEKVESAGRQLDEWLEAQKATDSDVVYKIKEAAVNVLKDNGNKYIKKVFEQIDARKTFTGSADEYADQYKIALQNIQKEINTKISSVIDAGKDAVKAMETEAIEKLKEAANDGVDSLREQINETISKQFGNATGNTGVASAQSSIISTLLSWRYSDYLQLFLLAGLVKSQETILLRTADVIELNMQQFNGGVLGYTEETETVEVSRLWGLIKYNKEQTVTKENSEAFKLKKAYTFLNVKATIQVKPLLLTLPLIAPSVDSDLIGTKWYEITYEGTMGY